MILILLSFLLFSFNSDIEEANSLYKNKNYSLFLEKCVPLLKTNTALKHDLNFQLKIAYASKRVENYSQAKSLYNFILKSDTLLNDFIDFELLQINLLEKDTLAFLVDLDTFISKHPNFSQNDRLLKKAINIAQNLNDTSNVLKYSNRLLKIDENYKVEVQYDKIQLIQDQNEFLKSSLEYIADFASNKNSSILIDSIGSKIDISILPDYQKFNLFKSSVLNKNQFSTNIINNYDDFQNYDKFNLYLSRYHINFKNYDEFITIINNVEDSITKFPKDIARELPRIYMRQKKTALAYRYYLEFARAYPNDPFSLNAVTFVLGKYRDSYPKKYVSILTEFANSNSKYEQYYRFLYVLYLYDNNYQRTCIDKINDYLEQAKSKWHRDRLLFWKSKILFELNNDEEAFKVLQELANSPFDNYYTIKAYVALIINEKTENELSQLGIRESKFTLGDLANDTRMMRLKVISEVFGRDYLKHEIEKIRHSFKSQEELSEVISFFEDNNFYYHAYIYNHQLNRNYFKGRSYTEKKEILNRLFPTYYLGMIDSISDPLKLQDPLVNAIIYRESAFQADAVSKANAHGLMQLIPETADLMSRRYRIPYRNVYDLYQPETNIALGTQYLDVLLKRFDNKFEVALAAYNAGSTRAKRWIKKYDKDNVDLFIEKIPFEQTRTYVKKVMYAYYIYKLIDFYDKDIYYSGIRKR